VYGRRDVRLLDGGREKWELEGREPTGETVTRAATTRTASAPDSSVRALLDEVLSAIGSRNLVDARSPEEF
jgi:thiosulfate/3-mercaptopyruvate sulfurtransferase